MTGKPRFARLKPREMHKTIALAGFAAPIAAIATGVAVSLAIFLAVPMAPPAHAQGRTFPSRRQPSPFSHAAISVSATLAWLSSLPMVKKPWN